MHDNLAPFPIGHWRLHQLPAKLSSASSASPCVLVLCCLISPAIPPSATSTSFSASAMSLQTIFCPLALALAASTFALCSRASSETGYLFWGPKISPLDPKSSAMCGRSSRHVRIERKHSNDARGMAVLLID
jgi:hypothetical protein